MFRIAFNVSDIGRFFGGVCSPPRWECVRQKLGPCCCVAFQAVQLVKDMTGRAVKDTRNKNI